MSDNNLIDVNRLLLVGSNGNIGDVLTRQSLKGVGWAPGAGITGIGVENGGVVVPGAFTLINAIGATFADAGGGVASLTVTPSGWTTVTKTADQSVGPGALALDTELFTGALVAGTKYRVRLHIFWNNQSSNGGDGQLATPARTFYRESQWFQNFGSGGNVNCVNVATAPIHYQNGNTGDGVMTIEVIITPSANGIVQWQFAGTAAGAGNCTVYAGSYLEWSAI